MYSNGPPQTNVGFFSVKIKCNHYLFCCNKSALQFLPVDAECILMPAPNTYLSVKVQVLSWRHVTRTYE